MKLVKLTKRQLKKDVYELLVDLKLYDEQKKEAYPSRLFVSEADYKKLTANTRRAFEKEYPFVSKEKLATSIAMYLLNYGPSTILAEGIKDGYAFISCCDI